MEKLEKFSDHKALVQYFLTDDSNVVKYLFDSPIQKDFKLNQDESNVTIDYIIKTFMLSIDKQIRNKIISHSEDDLSDAPTPYYRRIEQPPPPQMIRLVTENSR
jgi:hypothetical protein